MPTIAILLPNSIVHPIINIREMMYKWSDIWLKLFEKCQTVIIIFAIELLKGDQCGPTINMYVLVYVGKLECLCSGFSRAGGEH